MKFSSKYACFTSNAYIFNISANFGSKFGKTFVTYRTLKTCKKKKINPFDISGCVLNLDLLKQLHVAFPVPLNYTAMRWTPTCAWNHKLS